MDKVKKEHIEGLINKIEGWYGGKNPHTGTVLVVRKRVIEELRGLLKKTKDN